MLLLSFTFAQRGKCMTVNHISVDPRFNIQEHIAVVTETTAAEWTHTQHLMMCRKQSCCSSLILQHKFTFRCPDESIALKYLIYPVLKSKDFT